MLTPVELWLSLVAGTSLLAALRSALGRLFRRLFAAETGPESQLAPQS